MGCTQTSAKAVRNLNGPGGIALDLSRGLMYWADHGEGDIRQANLDGTGQVTLVKGLNGPGVVTLDLSPDLPITLQPGAASPGPFTLVWNALMGRGYQIQFKEDLAQTNWTNLGRALTATNTIMKAFDPVGPGQRRFYRVMLLP